MPQINTLGEVIFSEEEVRQIIAGMKVIDEGDIYDIMNHHVEEEKRFLKTYQIVDILEDKGIPVEWELEKQIMEWRKEFIAEFKDMCSDWRFVIKK